MLLCNNQKKIYSQNWAPVYSQKFITACTIPQKHESSRNVYKVDFSIRQVSPHDYDKLDTLMKQFVKEKQPFERLVMKKEDLLEMFKVILIYYTAS